MQNDSEKGPIAVLVKVEGVECTQTGGEPTGELQTGSWYIVENWSQENGWKEAAYVPQEYDVAWTQEAWMNWQKGYGFQRCRRL